MTGPRLIAGIALWTAIAAPTFLPAAEQQASLRIAAKSLQEQIGGTWRLVSIYQEDDGGREIDQFGGMPSGMFMADRQGNFSFQIMSNRGRYLIANSPPAVVRARPDGLLEAMTYFGAYSIDESQRKLTLHVAYCLFRGCDRIDREAELSINGSTLEMKSAMHPSPTGSSYSYLKWTRLCCEQLSQCQRCNTSPNHC